MGPLLEQCIVVNMKSYDHSLQGNVTTQTVLGGLPIYCLIANFL